ncbi:hypothetical protein AVEN_107561-1, partial [Araneus ventricosus]
VLKQHESYFKPRSNDEDEEWAESSSPGFRITLAEGRLAHGSGFSIRPHARGIYTKRRKLTEVT